MRFSSSDDELMLVNRIVLQTNSQDSGFISAEKAVNIFERTGLSTSILHEIWNIVDEDDDGKLSEREMAAAVRLIGWAQSGERVSEALLERPSPLPNIKGISDLAWTQGIPLSQFPLPTIRDRLNFHQLFQDSYPADGLLEGDKVRDIFLKSNLSYDNLAQIWNLVDTRERGSLDATEFSIGMFLIQALKTCQISSIPSSIPDHLYEQISDTPSLFPTSPTSPSSYLKKSFDAAHLRTKSFPSKFHLPSELSSESSDYWSITPEERHRSEEYFDVLDVQQAGFLEEDVAAKFMLRFKLSAGDLAHIWNLSDLNEDNRLTRDGFAVAMHLIHRRLAGHNIPSILPPSLAPLHFKTILATPPSPLPPKPDVALPSSQNLVFAIGPTPNLRRSLTVLPTYSSISTPNPSENDTVEDPFSNSIKKKSSTWKMRSPDVDNDAFNELRNETKGLRSQVEELMTQLRNQGESQISNQNLLKANAVLKSQLHEVEQSLSQVLSAHEGQVSTEELTNQITQLSSRNFDLENERLEVEESSRLLAEVSQSNEDLKQQITNARRAELTATEALTESRGVIQDLRREVTDWKEKYEKLDEERNNLIARVSDMQKVIAEPNSTSSIRELRMLLKDVTRENEKLKGRIRETEKSMTQLLLSSKDHARQEELLAENRRLTSQLRELETVANRIHSTSGDQNLRRVVEEMKRESGALKAQLREKDQAAAQAQTANDQRIGELQQKIDSLTRENTHLKRTRQNPPRDPEHDSSVPPPAYDDAFV